jgi:hypothetical protein
MPDPSKKKAKQTKESGTVFISNVGTYYSSPSINADTIHDLQLNVYASGLAKKQQHLIFTDEYTLEVKDPKGETDAELTQAMTTMCEAQAVNLWPNMIRAYNSVFWWGIALYNDVWEWVDNTYTLTALRHLPSYSFRVSSYSSIDVYSEILEGITLNNGEVEYWQVKDSQEIPKKLDYVFAVKDPVSDKLAGDPIILPLIPVINMLKFVWDTQMQQSNRTGAKILFIKVTDPQPASEANGNISDVEWANEIIENWGKNTAYQLRGNMELLDPGIKDDSNNLDVINALSNMLIDYITPTSYITSNSENRLGGSDKQREELILKYIQGVHSWIENAFEELLNKYLVANGYDGYRCYVEIPAPSVDNSQLLLDQARTGFDTQSLSKNEIRKRLGAEELDDEGIESLLKEYESVQTPLMFSNAETLTDTRDTEVPIEETTIEANIQIAAEKLAEDVIKALGA